MGRWKPGWIEYNTYVDRSICKLLPRYELPSEVEKVLLLPNTGILAWEDNMLIIMISGIPCTDVLIT